MSAEVTGYSPAGEITEVAAAVYASGEVVQLADGRAAYADTLSPIAVGDAVTFRTQGIVDLLSASATTFTKGDYVYWDASANLAITAPGADEDFFVGVAVKAKANGDVTVKTELNVVPTRTGLSLIVTREVLLDHADTETYTLLTAAENPNGLILGSFIGIVTEEPAGSSEDQIIITMEDEDGTDISTITTTNTTPDAVGDMIVGTLAMWTGTSAGVAAVVAAGKAVTVRITQATAGTPAGALKVHAVFIPRT